MEKMAFDENLTLHSKLKLVPIFFLQNQLKIVTKIQLDIKTIFKSKKYLLL